MNAPLPEKAADTSAEQPWPVRVLSLKIADYVDKMSPLWVEGQVVQINRRGTTAYLVLRDPDVDMSLAASISVHAIAAMGSPLDEGARVVLQAKPVFWPKRGTLMLDARQIRPVGVGDLLARIEILKQRLAQEGLFDADRKRPLPFLPRQVGLVTGRGSAAEKDVVENARRRWPSVRFAIREVAVQGSTAVAEVSAAVKELDADPEVDVIVIARGGGAAEELLPFSNETLLRVVSEARTPVISAIGHDVDTPLLDFVADWRASTPTDAGRRVVPDAEGELRGTAQAVARATRALGRRLDHERHILLALRSRPVMADPIALVTRQRELVGTLREAGPATGCSPASCARRTRCATSAPASEASRPSRPSNAGMRWCSTATAGWSCRATRSSRDELLRVRVARGDFGVRPVTGPDDGSPSPAG